MLQIHSTSSESKVHSFPQLSNQEGQEVLQQDQPYIITELILIQELTGIRLPQNQLHQLFLALPSKCVYVCVLALESLDMRSSGL